LSTITPTNLHDILLKEVEYYQELNDADKEHFTARIKTFLSEVYIEAVDSELTDKDIALVASSAVIPVFKFKEWHYANLKTVLIYPNNFDANLDHNAKAQHRTIGGLVGTGRFENQMLLSRESLYHGFKNNSDKLNTGIHEFIHLIDKLDGDVDGIPKVLMHHSYTIPWLDLIHEKMEAINDDKSDMRNYGGTSRIEFFAVACEYFFSRPKLMKRKHPELYKMLRVCFG
jgi:Mlc titration factor MtfA (ptsG expression regulator)